MKHAARLAGLLCVAFLGCAAASIVATASAQGAEPDDTHIADDFPIAMFRGLALADTPDGPKVVVGNDNFEAGVVIYQINGQETRTAREVKLVAAAVAASNAAEISVMSRYPDAAATKPPYTRAEWADALLLSETPNGVLVDYSLEPKEIGLYLKRINDQPVSSVADAERLLAAVLADPGNYKLEWAGSNTKDAAAEGHPVVVLPAIPYDDASMPVRHLLLAKAVAQEVPRPTAGDTQVFSQSWGALARLAGRFYSGEVFTEMCDREAAGRSPCYALVWWSRPGRVLVRDWYAGLGYLVASDTILPTGRPGVFAVHRWVPQGNRTSGYGDVGKHHIRVSANHVVELGHAFQVTERPTAPGQAADDPVTVQLLGTVDGYTRSMVSTSRSAAIKLAGELWASVQESIKAQEERDRAARRSNAMAGIYNAMMGVGHAIQADNNYRQAEFDRRMAAAATRATSTDAGMSDAQGASTSDTGSSTKLVPKTFRFFLWAPISANESDTRNPVCYSNVLVEPFMGDPHSWGDPGRKIEIFEKYRPAFEDKCSRLGQLVDGTTFVEDDGRSDFGVLHPTDRRVTLP